MKQTPRFRFLMILQLCLGFSVLVWLLICPSILERGDYRARESLAHSIEQTAQKHPHLHALNEQDLGQLHMFINQKVNFPTFYPSNFWLTLSLLLTNTTSLLLLLSYRASKWICLPALICMLVAFSYLPMPLITHPLLDPRIIQVSENASFEQAKNVWQNKLVEYYSDSTSKAQNATEKLDLSKQLFEYDLLKNNQPVPGGFFFPASFWMTIVIFLHALWAFYIFRFLQLETKQ